MFVLQHPPMSTRFSVASAVHARAGDILSVFLVAGSPPLGSVQPSRARAILKSTVQGSTPSPVVFNETAHAWAMTDAQALGGGARAVGQAIPYRQTPDPGLPIARVVRGTVLETALVQDKTYGRLDTVIVLEVFDDRELAPQQPWIPTTDS